MSCVHAGSQPKAVLVWLQHPGRLANGTASKLAELMRPSFAQYSCHSCSLCSSANGCCGEAQYGSTGSRQCGIQLCSAKLHLAG